MRYLGLRYVSLDSFLASVLEITLIIVPVFVIYHDHKLYNLSQEVLRHKNAPKKLAEHDFQTNREKAHQGEFVKLDPPSSAKSFNQEFDITAILNRAGGINKPKSRSRQERVDDKIIEDLEHMALKMVQWDRRMGRVEGSEIVESIDDKIKPETTASETKPEKTQNLPFCNSIWRQFASGNIEVYKSVDRSWEDVNNAMKDNVINGCYVPDDCVPEEYLYIVIPFRNRDSHLKKLLYVLHPMLQRQRRAYCVIVSEQYGHGVFNSGYMKNVGFVVGSTHKFYKDQKIEPSCVIFHDVDLIPENDLNLYHCHDNYVIHMSDRIDKFHYVNDSGCPTGGVFSMKRNLYKDINGHPNMHYGWGGEDGDIGWRVRSVLKFRKNIEQTGSTTGKYHLPAENGVGMYQAIEHPHSWMHQTKSPTGESQIDMHHEILAASGIFLRAHKSLRRHLDGLRTLKFVVRKIDYRKSHARFICDIRPWKINEIKAQLFEIRGETREKNTKSTQHAEFRVSPSELQDSEDTGQKVDDCEFVKYNQTCVYDIMHRANTYKTIKDNEFSLNDTNLYYNYDRVPCERDVERDCSEGGDDCAAIFRMSPGYSGYDLVKEMCQLRSVPFPLKTCSVNSLMRRFLILKSCPSKMGMFQLLSKTPVLLNYKTETTVELVISYNVDILRASMGRLMFRAVILFETKRFACYNIPIDTFIEGEIKLDAVGPGNYDGFESSPEMESSNKTCEVTEGSYAIITKNSSNLSIKINLKLPKSPPGWYAMTSTIVDDFQAPYAETHLHCV